MDELPSTMQALQLRRLGHPERVDLPVPTPGAGEVLIRTSASTICTSDLSDIHDDPFGLPLPRVLGHEAAGVVSAVGPGGAEIAVGDRVAAHPVIPCHQCAECRRGLAHLCRNLGHLAVDRDGTFAEFFRLPCDRVRRIPDALDMSQAALLEPVAVSLEAVRRARVGAGDFVLVAGDGPFGVMIARLAGRTGARTLLTGRHTFRLRRATGATPIHVGEVEDPLAAVRGATDGEGVDAAILAADSQEALDLCLASLRPRGRLAVFAVMPERPRIDMLRLLVNELDLVGACNDEDLLDEALDLIIRDELGLGELVTHRVPFDRWEQALDIAANRPDEALKVSMVFRDG